MQIYLIGAMGTGKTTIGQALALRLQYDFVDTDQLVEQQTQQSIATIFAEQGEAHFRQLEQKLLQQTLAPMQQIVVATGGGMPCFFDNLKTMKQHGVLIYLSATPSVLAQRLWQHRSHRPLIAAHGNETTLADFMQQQLEVREPYYRQAHFVVNSEQAIDDIVASIAAKVTTFRFVSEPRSTTSKNAVTERRRSEQRGGSVCGVSDSLNVRMDSFNN